MTLARWVSSFGFLVARSTVRHGALKTPTPPQGTDIGPRSLGFHRLDPGFAVSTSRRCLRLAKPPPSGVPPTLLPSFPWAGETVPACRHPAALATDRRCNAGKKAARSRSQISTLLRRRPSRGANASRASQTSGEAPQDGCATVPEDPAGRICGFGLSLCAHVHTFFLPAARAPRKPKSHRVDSGSLLCGLSVAICVAFSSRSALKRRPVSQPSAYIRLSRNSLVVSTRSSSTPPVLSLTGPW